VRLLLSIIICSLFFLGCKKSADRKCAKSVGDSITETRELDEFNQLRLFGGIDYDLVQDSLNKVVIRCGENLMNFIDTKIEDGVLVVTDENTCTWLRKLPTEINMEIHYSDLHNVYIEGHGDLKMLTTHHGQDFRLDSWHVNTKCDIDVDVDLLTLTINGGGSEMTVRGQTNAVYYHHDGLGIIDGRQLNSSYYWANNQHEGLIRLGFPDGGGLQYVIDSYGDITYTGTPENVELIERQGSGQLLQE